MASNHERYFAHTAELLDGSRDRDEDHWQLLSVHLGNVVKLAKQFAALLRLTDEGDWPDRCMT